MTLLVLSPETVWNPGLLKFSSAPRKILQRGLVLPRSDAPKGAFLRAICESQALRFAITLVPFLAAGLIWPSLALPLGSAPIFMLIAIGVVEMRVLRLPKQKRDNIVSEAEAARALDTLNFRGRKILTQIAAAQQMQTGILYLVVEQSDMIRLSPFTLVSVQADQGKSRLVPLSAETRQMIRDTLFDDDFTEQELQFANLRENEMLRSVAYDARGVSGHMRLAAFLDKTPEPVEATA